jgi:hypothetical protein
MQYILNLCAKLKATPLEEGLVVLEYTVSLSVTHSLAALLGSVWLSWTPYSPLQWPGIIDSSWRPWGIAVIGNDGGGCDDVTWKHDLKKNKTGCLLLRVDGLKKTGTLSEDCICYTVPEFCFDVTTKKNLVTQKNSRAVMVFIDNKISEIVVVLSFCASCVHRKSVSKCYGHVNS